VQRLPSACGPLADPLEAQRSVFAWHPYESAASAYIHG
jgi:hypothetical protein